MTQKSNHTHGGTRAGAGRKPKQAGEKYAKVLICLTQEMYLWLRTHKANTGESVSETIRRAVSNVM